MQPEDLAKDAGTLIIFFFLFSPGFISMKTFDAWFSAEPRKAVEYIYEIFGYSCVNYVLLGPYLIWVLNQQNWQNNYTLLWISAVFFLLVPAVLGSLVALLQFLLLKSGRIFVGSTKTAWDWAFKSVGESGVVIEMQDGTEVVGSFANSAAISAYPFDQAIYLDRLWLKDSSGQFERPIVGSKGQYIDGKHIKTVLFYDLPESQAAES